MPSVFLYIPNIIGYFRFLLLFAIFFTYQSLPVATVFLYGLSQLLDMFDGMAARYFNQCSDFGAVLDMVCDRASNGVLLAICGHLYPEHAWLFYGDIVLDLVSHWYQMYAALSKGEHHKQVRNKFRLLDVYYNNKIVLGGLVAGNQVFLLACYLLAFRIKLEMATLVHQTLVVLLVCGGVLFAIKKLMSVLQLIGSAQTIAQRDAGLQLTQQKSRQESKKSA